VKNLLGLFLSTIAFLDIIGKYDIIKAISRGLSVTIGGEQMGESNSEMNKRTQGAVDSSASRFFREVVFPLAMEPRADIYCLSHFVPPSDEPAPHSSPINDGEKDENRIYVIYYPPEVNGPTGHVALMYKGKTVDLYPEKIGLDHGGLSEKLSVCASGCSKRKRDTDNGTLHSGLKGNTRVVAISPNQLKSFYQKVLRLTEDEAQKRLEGIEQRIGEIRGEPDKGSGWKDWLIMGNEKSGNCTDGVRYALGFPRKSSTFLFREKGLSLPSSLYRLLNAMVNAGYGNRVTPEYYSKVKFNQGVSNTDPQNSNTQAALLHAAVASSR